jgi:hypothetical protein
MPLEGFYSFPNFFFLFTDIQLIFGTLLCHTKIRINFEFGSDPLIFSSPELKAQVSYSDRPLSVVRLSVNFYIFDFFSRTTGPILTRLGTNQQKSGDSKLFK